MPIISSLLIALTLHFLLIREYAIFQAHHYELDKYLLEIKNTKRYYAFLYSLLSILVIKKEMFFTILVLLFLVYLIKKYNLKYTNRVKRIIALNIICLAFFAIFRVIKYVYIFSFFYICFLHFLSIAIEKIVFIKYLKRAKEKVKDKIVIGITGSGGKTSIKNMIYDLLINKDNVSKTPKSFNNRVGIVKGINEEVKEYDRYFICEYGVDKVNGMDKLIKIVKPDLVVISYIGNQHLLTFKTKENILKEKMKLVESIKEGGVVVINNDDSLLCDYNYKGKTVIKYGINSYSDVMGKNVICDTYHSEFDLYIKDMFISHVNTDLLSIHSVENILASIATLIGLGMDIDFIVENLNKIRPIEHRLEFKYIDGIEVLDDSFNSNVKGFINAVDILLTSNKYKVVITPGIIEQGDENENTNRSIAKKLIECDFVCLVSDNAISIKKEFIKNEYYNFGVFEHFNEAFEFVKEIDKDKIVLIENDLPDIYLK
jgi:UDP-N-acetylmuramoyl-tripeptide--D-alanyl-D-alanine ligase